MLLPLERVPAPSIVPTLLKRTNPVAVAGLTLADIFIGGPSINELGAGNMVVVANLRHGDGRRCASSAGVNRGTGRIWCMAGRQSVRFVGS